jgi:hypothetical protein
MAAPASSIAIIAASVVSIEGNPATMKGIKALLLFAKMVSILLI